MTIPMAGVLCVSMACAMTALGGGPGAHAWRGYASAEDAGFSSDGLEVAYGVAQDLGSAAVLVMREGAVVQAWGAINHPYRTHSMRKSLYSVTFGAMLDQGVDLSATIGELGIDDLGGLSDAEKQATVAQLLNATSGVYHNAAYETESNAGRRPERGTHAPGTFWYYNNWDFNVLPTVFALQTGDSISDAFKERLATPLGMEDFDQQRDVFEWLEPTVSSHPAILFRISARDLARIGQMMLDDGAWDGKQVLPASWAQESTSAITTFDDGHYRGIGNGYGYLWWRFPARPGAEMEWQRHDRIAAIGAGGHAMFLVPDLDLIIVHRTDTDRSRGVGDMQAVALLDAIVQTCVGGVRADATLVDVETRPLGRAPAPVASERTPVQADEIAALVGIYATERGDQFSLFEFDGRLFARRESEATGEAELFLNANGELFSPVAPLRMRATERADGAVTALTLWFQGREMELSRVTE